MDAVCRHGNHKSCTGVLHCSCGGVADESFASEVMSVTINAAAKDEPTEPTVNITYDDKNGNVNAIFTNITEEGWFMLQNIMRMVHCFR